MANRGKDKMDTQTVFMNLLKENWANARHQETQRMWIANIFIAIVIGTSAYLSKADLKEIPWFIPLIFLIISTLCLLITLKLNRVFADTQESIKNIFNDDKISLRNDGDWRNYMRGLESTGRIWKILRVRYLYIALYAIAIAASLWFLISVLVNN